MVEPTLLAAQNHIRFCLMHLRMLPTPYETEDSNRMSLAFFVLSSLDLLMATDKTATTDRRAWINWIYEQQCAQGGFSGSPSLRIGETNLDPPHLAMTYTALANLAILGDDLSRVNWDGLKTFVKSCQLSDGSFAPYPGSPEKDIRFVYCAFVISHLVGGENLLFRVEDAVKYVLKCRNHDGAFGQMPCAESQGGTTYCAIASLHLADRMSSLPARQSTMRWLFQRLVCVEPQDIPDEQKSQSSFTLDKLRTGKAGGFQGRPEKDPDVCYSFWVGASIQLLQGYDCLSKPNLSRSSPVQMHLLQPESYQYFIYATQNSRGGIGKYFEEPSDVYHTYLGLAGLTLESSAGLKALNAELNMCTAAAQHFMARRTTGAPET